MRIHADSYSGQTDRRNFLNIEMAAYVPDEQRDTVPLRIVKRFRQWVARTRSAYARVSRADRIAAEIADEV